MTENVCVAVVVFDGCIGSTVHGLVDAFACANACATEEKAAWPTFETRLVSRDGKAVVTFSGQPLAVAGDLAAAEDCDIVLLSPFMPFTTPPRSVGNRIAPLTDLVPWLRARAAAGACIGTSCTGSFLLAETGLLDGKVATTHWRAAQAFRERYPEVVLRESELVTENGNLMCGGGATSYLDLALHLIRRFAGPALALQCAKLLVFDPGRDGQSPYLDFAPHKAHGDHKILQAQDWIEQNYWVQIDAESLAKILGMSSRNLKRRFKAGTGETITSYLQGVRIAAACDRLVAGKAQIQQIIYDVGYSDVASFGRLFKTVTGVTMGEYRRRFLVSSRKTAAGAGVA